MLDKGIATRRGIMNSHREKAYLDLGYKDYLPISEDAADNSIVIPLYVPMNADDINSIIKEFKELLL